MQNLEFDTEHEQTIVPISYLVELNCLKDKGLNDVQELNAISKLSKLMEQIAVCLETRERIAK